MSIVTPPITGHDYSNNREKPCRVDADGRLEVSLASIGGQPQSPFNFLHHLQRFQHRALWGYYGIDFTWAAYGSKIPAGTIQDVLKVLGACGLYQIQFQTRWETRKLACYIEMDGEQHFYWWRAPECFSIITGSTPPSPMPFQMGAATCIRYDTANNKYVLLFEPRKIQGGQCRKSVSVRIINDYTADLEACIHIMWGMPTSVFSRKAVKILPSPDSVRQNLAEKLGTSPDRLTVCCAVGATEQGADIAPFVEVSAPDEYKDMLEPALTDTLKDLGVL